MTEPRAHAWNFKIMAVKITIVERIKLSYRRQMVSAPRRLKRRISIFSDGEKIIMTRTPITII